LTAARQLALEFTPRAALGLDDFLVVPGNATAVSWLDRWPDWPNRAFAVFGPAGCGKTHLAHVWQAQSRGRIVAAADLQASALTGLVEATGATPPALAIEDADRGVDETALFHLYNMIVEAGGTMLLTSREAPARWRLELPDLASRMAAVPAAALDEPDDELFAAVLVKQFADRQLGVGAEVVAYLTTHMERSFDAARRIVSELDKAALAGRRGITVPLAREILKSNNLTTMENDEWTSE